MPKGSRSKSLLPHLTPAELSERDNQESRLSEQLLACWRKDQFDIERAYAFTRSYAVELFVVLLNAYQKKPGYVTQWVPQILNEAILRVLQVAERHFGNLYTRQQWEQLGVTLETTITEHLRHDSQRQAENPAPETPEITLTGRQSAAYARAGVDMSSASPLLRMAHNAAQDSRQFTPPATSIGEQIRQLREECRFTNEDLAAALEVDRRSVVRHISGKYKPAKRHVAAYERVFSEKLRRTVRLKTSL